MKEYAHLVAEHDIRVALCIVQNGHNVNWRDALPDEVLYVPEEVFDLCAPHFIKEVGDRYYGTMELSGDLLKCSSAISP